VTRTVRIVLACIILISTVSISVSSASPVQAQGSTSPIHVQFDWAPIKIVCLGETAQVGIFHYWDMASAPMVPLDGQPLLVTSAKHGSVNQPSLAVSSYPGLARMTYTAETSGTETLSTTFSFGPAYSATATTTFKVRKCNYKLSIQAFASKNMSDVIVGVYFETIGNIYVTADKIMGELNGFAKITLNSNNDAYFCSLVPEPKSNAKVTISGTQDTNVWGSTVTHLQVVYQPVARFPAANEVCNDKTSDHLEIRNTPFPTPDGYDPGADLQTTLDFISGQKTLQVGPFGKIGDAYFRLEPIDDTSSGNGN
jgi:hypothetical protein